MAACLFYLLRVCVPPDVFDFARRKQSRDRTWAVALMTLGATFTVLIVLKYNPWSGALWSIWTFMGVCWFIAEKRRGVADRPSAVALHRWGMGFLGGFSFWGALQGFVPGIVMALRGPDMSDKPYVGNLPGEFSPFFFVFLFGWTVPIAIGMFIAHRSGLKARQRRPQAG
jgi:hypothetical protein